MSEVDKRRQAKTGKLHLEMSQLPETARPAVQYYVCLLWAYAEVRVTPASSMMMNPSLNTRYYLICCVVEIGLCRHVDKLAYALLSLLKDFKNADVAKFCACMGQAKPAVQQRVLALDAAEYDPESNAQQLQFACIEAAADTLLSPAAGAAFYPE